MVPETSFTYSCCMNGWSPPYPEHLEVMDCSYVPSIDRTTIVFLLGGRQFDLICSGALFPSTVAAVELWPPGLEIRSVFHELARLLRLACGKQLATFSRENSSLADILHVWNVSAFVTDGRLQVESPTRGSRVDELFSGVEYQDVDLPWHDWESIQVLEKMSDTHFLVSVHGSCFGCYVPEGVFEYEAYSIFLQEVRAWKRISNTPGIPQSIPRLTGLVHAQSSPSKLEGVLYEWVDLHKTTPCLSQVNVNEVPMEQKRAWLHQIELAVDFLRAGRASLTRNGCKGNVAERISITTNGEVRLRIVHFGGVENYRGPLSFGPHMRADYRLLAELRSFFKINYDTIVQPEPFRLLCLPAEVRNSIYEILLVFPGRTRWVWGYRHQADASVTADFPNEIPGRGLLSTNRQIRRESLSCLIGQNHFHLNALWLASFLDSSTQVDLNGSLERVMVGSYLRRITLTITLTWQKHITREQSKGIKALVANCPNLEHVELLIHNRYTWYWESDTLWADIKKLPNVRLEEHWDGDTLDQLGLSTALMLD